MIGILRKKETRGKSVLANTGLGLGWAGVGTATPRPNTASGSAQIPCVVYRTQKICLCTRWSGLLVDDFNLTSNRLQASTISVDRTERAESTLQLGRAVVEHV